MRQRAQIERRPSQQSDRAAEAAHQRHEVAGKLVAIVARRRP